VTTESSVCVRMFLMWGGSEFQAVGPATANEPSAKCVLVRRTVKSTRTDDWRRWSLDRLHKSAKYWGAVPWKTSNIKTHSLYFMRLEIGSQCRRCSSGAAWLRASSEQTRRAALSWIRCILLRTATLQFAKSPLSVSSNNNCIQEITWRHLIQSTMVRRENRVWFDDLSH